MIIINNGLSYIIFVEMKILNSSRLKRIYRVRRGLKKFPDIFVCTGGEGEGEGEISVFWPPRLLTVRRSLNYRQRCGDDDDDDDQERRFSVQRFHGAIFFFSFWRSARLSALGFRAGRNVDSSTTTWTSTGTAGGQCGALYMVSAGSLETRVLTGRV